MKDIQLYRVDISDNDDEPEEVDFIAVVKSPAIQSDFLKFAERQKFIVQDEEERIVTGLAMIADLPILRRDSERGEYYVFFDAAAIKKIALRFFRKGYQRNFNENHDPNKKKSGVYVFESYIIDREKGKNPPEAFEDVSNGSWLISAKIDDPELWDRIKSGEFKGFSVEGFFNLEKVELASQEEEDIEIDEEFVNQLREVLKDFHI